MRNEITVRPFESTADYERMLDYFYDATGDFLRSMGVEPSLLPEREQWLQASLADHDRPDDEKDRFYLAWLVGAELVGNSSISHIEPSAAHMHMHLWRPNLRRQGVGTEFSAQSVDYYFDRFGFRRLASEPFAANPAPNRVLTKLGFEFIKRYTTVPSTIALRQDVNRYETTREAWMTTRHLTGEPNTPTE